MHWNSLKDLKKLLRFLLRVLLTSMHRSKRHRWQLFLALRLTSQCPSFLHLYDSDEWFWIERRKKARQEKLQKTKKKLRTWRLFAILATFYAFWRQMFNFRDINLASFQELFNKNCLSLFYTGFWYFDVYALRPLM